MKGIRNFKEFYKLMMENEDLSSQNTPKQAGEAINLEEILKGISLTPVTFNDNTQMYFDKKLNLHNEGGPAVIYPDNERQEWWVNGQLHREDGPAIDIKNGKKGYFNNGKLDRKDGPAVESDQIQECKFFVDNKEINANQYFANAKEWYGSLDEKQKKSLREWATIFKATDFLKDAPTDDKGETGVTDYDVAGF